MKRLQVFITKEANQGGDQKVYSVKIYFKLIKVFCLLNLPITYTPVADWR
jgi:hypothetical protein